MQKIKVLEEGEILIPKQIVKKLGIKEGSEFNIFADSETIYLRRIHRSVKDTPFKEIAKPFRIMATREGLTSKDVQDEIRKYRQGKP